MTRTSSVRSANASPSGTMRSLTGGGSMTRTTGRAGLLVLVAMAMGCGGNSQKSQAPDAGGWTTVPPTHDAGRSDAPGLDGKATRDAAAGADAKATHDAGVDARTSHDAGIDTRATHDAGIDARAGHDAGIDARAGHDAAVDARAGHDAGIDARAGHDAARTSHDALLPGGGTCASSAECATGFCADGVCCNTACSSPCVSCVLAGAVGTCLPAQVGSPDPHALCGDQGAASCGRDGVCDGIGGCELYPAQTLCARPSCSGNTLVVSGTCDGAGVCVAGRHLACTPYACVDGACLADCLGPGDCAPGQICMAGTCGNGHIEGVPCTQDSECLDGICSQGACCASRCDGVCSSCALPGSLGTCMPVPASQRPDGSVCP
jgi:hypothetical protein